MSAGRLFHKIQQRSTIMSESRNDAGQDTKKITREQADRLNDFAHDLDDEITHIVDYGELLDEDEQ